MLDLALRCPFSNLVSSTRGLIEHHTFKSHTTFITNLNFSEEIQNLFSFALNLFSPLDQDQLISRRLDCTNNVHLSVQNFQFLRMPIDEGVIGNTGPQSHKSTENEKQIWILI